MWSLGKYLTETDAALLGIDIVVKSLLSMLEGTNHRHAEISIRLRLALTAIENARHWTLPVITSIARHTRRIEEEGARIVLTWLADDRDKGGLQDSRRGGATSSKTAT